MLRGRIALRALAMGTLMMVAAGRAPAQGQTPVFRSAPRYTLPGNIQTFYLESVKIADVGAPLGHPPDGIPDLITANQDGIAAVLFGTADLRFPTGINTVVDGTPTALAVDDFDGDGLKDLVVADASNTLSFYKNPIDGLPFTNAHKTAFAGVNPVALAVADLDGDKKLDVIIVDEGVQTGGVTILLGNGDGSFKPPAPMIASGFQSHAVALGKFTTSGKIDLAVANAGAGTVTILRGDGKGGFTAVPNPLLVGGIPVAIVAADLNHDFRPDLIVLDNDSGDVVVLEGLPGPAFKPAQFYPSGTVGSSPNGLALADVNGDGDTDIVVSNNFSGDVSVLLGDGKGGLSLPRTFVADQEPLAVGVIDVNGDQLDDAIAITRDDATPNAVVLFGLPDGRLSGVENVITDSNPSLIVAGDIDNDGMSDLVISHRAASSTDKSPLMLYRADTKLGFVATASLQSSGDALAVGRGDFNADGRLDLAALNKLADGSGSVSVLLGKAGGSFGTPPDVPARNGAGWLTIGDLNGDSRSDLVVAAAHTADTTGFVDVLLAVPAGGFGAPRSVTLDSMPVAIETGDFNKDGRLDVALLSSKVTIVPPDQIRSDIIVVLLGKGDGTFQAAPIVTTIPGDSGPRALAVADFDRDGFDDVAVALATTQSTVVFYGTGSGSFSQGPSLPVNAAPISLAARDVTGDFIPDLLISYGGTANAVALFIGSGATRTFQRQTVTVSRQPSSVLSADFDGDGRYDAACVNQFIAGTVSVLTNQTAPAVLRGDGNNDGVVSAADTVAALREATDADGARIEQIHKAGTYQAGAGVDANGDGVVTVQDALAVAHRIFSGS